MKKVQAPKTYGMSNVYFLPMLLHKNAGKGKFKHPLPLCCYASLQTTGQQCFTEKKYSTDEMNSL